MKDVYYKDTIRPTTEGVVKYRRPHVHYVVYVKSQLRKETLTAIKNCKTKKEADELFKNTLLNNVI
jgi:hypothetical protein